MPPYINYKFFEDKHYIILSFSPSGSQETYTKCASTTPWNCWINDLFQTDSTSLVSRSEQLSLSGDNVCTLTCPTWPQGNAYLEGLCPGGWGEVVSTASPVFSQAPTCLPFACSWLSQAPWFGCTVTTDSRNLSWKIFFTKWKFIGVTVVSKVT